MYDEISVLVESLLDHGDIIITLPVTPVSSPCTALMHSCE